MGSVGSSAQTIQVLKVTAMDLGASGGEGLGGGIRTSEADHIVARFDQFLNDGRADEARRTGNEDTHVLVLSKFLSSLRRVGRVEQTLQCFIGTVASAISSSSANVSGDSVNSAAARFSRRWATDDVPGINRMLGDRCSNQASATCIGVAPSRCATADSVDDCNGVNPPSGKNGTYAMPCLAKSSIKASSFRLTKLQLFCTHTISMMACASTTWAAVTLLNPMWRINPWRLRSANTVTSLAMDPSAGPWMAPMAR